MIDWRPSWRLLVLPAVAGLLVIGVRIVTTYAFAAAGVDAYQADRFDASETRFGRLEPLNVVHPWRAHFGLGDARYRQGELGGAETAFARALDLEPDRCEVRFNLAVTIEAQGDWLVVNGAFAAGDPDQVVARSEADVLTDPAERYVVAIGIIDDGDCPSAVADDVGDRLATSRARILAKLIALDQGRTLVEERDDTEESSGSQGGDNEQQLNDIEQRNTAAAGLRDEGRDRGAPGATPDNEANW